MMQKLNADWIQYIFTNMDDAVCMTRMSGEVFFANPSAERLAFCHHCRTVNGQADSDFAGVVSPD